MNSLTLKILLTVYILYALLKFFEFFFRHEETKMKGLYTVYVKGGGAVVKIFDNVVLAFMLVLLGLLFMGGVEHASFSTQPSVNSSRRTTADLPPCPARPARPHCRASRMGRSSI